MYISYTQALLAGQMSIKDANYIHTYMGYGRGIYTSDEFKLEFPELCRAEL